MADNMTQAFLHSAASVADYVAQLEARVVALEKELRAVKGTSTITAGKASTPPVKATWEWSKRGAWCLADVHPTPLIMSRVTPGDAGKADGYTCVCGNNAPGRDWDGANEVGVPLGSLKATVGATSKPEPIATAKAQTSATGFPKWADAKALGLCWRGCGKPVTTGNLCDACRALKKAGK